VGVDRSRWKTEKHFVSWLGLCPDNRTGGGKVLKRGARHVVNRASTALRLAAWPLRSQSALGAKFRRLRSKLGAPKSITAMAHMLARLDYRMLKFGLDYVDRGTHFAKPNTNTNDCNESQNRPPLSICNYSSHKSCQLSSGEWPVTQPVRKAYIRQRRPLFNKVEKMLLMLGEHSVCNSNAWFARRTNEACRTSCTTFFHRLRGWS
jgi:hypothetical protein